MQLVLGIDTGGTYTDGALLDFASRQVLRTAKALTTRHDLALGILEAVDALAIPEPGAVRLVSISTTLATNAIAEGKGRRTALFLIGYDAELVRTFDFGGRFATPSYFFFRGGHDLFGQPQAELDVDGLRRQARALAGQVDALAVSAYFSPLNPAHEQQAFEAIRQAADMPVVLAHHLSTKLNSIERATTASLNASLVAVLRDFVAGVQAAMRARGILAPLMIVRGDGTLMSAEVADRHAVETIHSGPAASAIGGRFLSGRDPALVVDIGGTTTDLAVVDGGQVKVDEEGATVAGFRTAVRAAQVRSFGLGGDSWLWLDKEERLQVGPVRVTPLAALASRHPRVRQELLALGRKPPAEAPADALEYWFLVRPQQAQDIRDRRVTQLLDLLAGGPRPLPVILKALGLAHPLQISEHRLLEREVIGRAGLTPTDLLHARGALSLWDAAAAAGAVEVFARLRGWTAAELDERTQAWMTERIVAESVQFLSGRPVAGGDDQARQRDLGRWFFENSLRPSHPYLAASFRLKMPLIGIGAPAAVYLPAVARALNTELILPPHYAVANAVGAVSGSVVATREALVYTRIRDLSPVGYVAQVGDTRREFLRQEEALAFARAEAGRQSLAEAAQSGAAEPHLHIEQIANGVEAYRLRAQAVGSPRLMPERGEVPRFGAGG